jgi:hypothetical protein
MRNPRRFPPPWTVEEQEACFIVRDHNGQALRLCLFTGAEIGGEIAHARLRRGGLR